MKKKKTSLKERLINIHIYDAIKYIVYLYITHAVIHVSSKLYTHSKYDMQKLLVSIQEYYPNSKLTFQNIVVIDNDLKISKRGTSTYREKEYLYIRNGELRKEPNYLYLLLLTPGVVFFIVFNLENLNIKLKDIPKLDTYTKGAIIITCIIACYTLLTLNENEYQFKRHKNPKAFKNHIKQARKEIQVNDYRK